MCFTTQIKRNFVTGLSVLVIAFAVTGVFFVTQKALAQFPLFEQVSSLPVRVNPAQVAEPVGVSHIANDTSVLLLTPDGGNLLYTFADNTLFYANDTHGMQERYLESADCKRGGTIYLYFHGWSYFFDCSTQSLYANQTGYPVTVVGLNEDVGLNWITLEEEYTFLPDNVWSFRRQSDGTILVFAPLGEILRVGDQVYSFDGTLRAPHAPAWMFQVGEMKILIRQASDVWQYAEHK